MNANVSSASAFFYGALVLSRAGSEDNVLPCDATLVYALKQARNSHLLPDWFFKLMGTTDASLWHLLHEMTDEAAEIGIVEYGAPSFDQQVLQTEAQFGITTAHTLEVDEEHLASVGIALRVYFAAHKELENGAAAAQ